MAGWLRRWTSDLIWALRADSIPGVGNFFLKFHDDSGASRAGMSAANVGASIRYFEHIGTTNGRWLKCSRVKMYD